MLVSLNLVPAFRFKTNIPLYFIFLSFQKKKSEIKINQRDLPVSDPKTQETMNST